MQASEDMAAVPAPPASPALAGGHGLLVPPIQHVAEIGIDDANALLVAWGHLMGPCRRPNAQAWAHAMFMHGEPVAVAVTASLVRETCAGLTRAEAIELARLCAGRPWLNRAMLRIWREAVLPPLCRAYGWSWAVSYQDELAHSGNTYRFDGWTVLGRSSSGTDKRSGRKGRRKTIWGWHVAPVGEAG